MHPLQPPPSHQPRRPLLKLLPRIKNPQIKKHLPKALQILRNRDNPSQRPQHIQDIPAREPKRQQLRISRFADRDPRGEGIDDGFAGEVLSDEGEGEGGDGVVERGGGDVEHGEGKGGAEGAGAHGAVGVGDCYGEVETWGGAVDGGVAGGGMLVLAPGVR